MHPDTLTDPICQMDLRGIEPLSESLFTRPSPGASVYLNSLSVPGNGTLHGQVAS